MSDTGFVPQSISSQRAMHPLVIGMGEVGELNPYFNLPVLKPRQDEWINAADLFLGDNNRLRHLVMTHGLETWKTSNNHVAGSAFITAYLARLTWPVVGQYVLKRRVPQVSLDNLAFHLSGKRIDGSALIQPKFAVLSTDPDAGHKDAEVVANEAMLYSRLKQWMFDCNLSQVIAALHRASRASIKVSQHAVAAAVSQAFHHLYAASDDPQRLLHDSEHMFGDASLLMYQQVTMEIFEHQGRRGYFSRRAGCCLKWRTRESRGYCSNCILLPREMQDQQFRELLVRQG